MKKRVRAIIKQGSYILLIHRIKKQREYWVFPGGGVEQKEDLSEALIRECREELGVIVEVGELFASIDVQNQLEYFYYCKIIGGELGTGDGPEFQQESGYEGVYALEWIPLIEFSVKNIQPEKVKDKLRKEA